MLAVQPYWEVTMQHGEETSRLLTTTFSTFLSKMSFITLHRGSNLALSASFFFFSSSSSVLVFLVSVLVLADILNLWLLLGLVLLLLLRLVIAHLLVPLLLHHQADRVADEL